MFDFGLMERVMDVIRGGAQTRMTDKAFLERELLRWKASSDRAAMIDADRYYRGDHDILRRQRTVIGAGGVLTVVTNLPNNREVDNQYAKMVDQKKNYLLGKQMTVETDSDEFLQLLQGMFNRRFHRMIQALGRECISGGIAWLMPYISDAGALAFKKFPAHEILPFWADAEHTILEAAVRLYLVDAYEGEIPKVLEKVEVYTDKGVYRFELQDGILIQDGDAPLSPYATDAAGTAWNWTRIPLIPFKANDIELPLLSRVRSLQDGINAVLSDFRNNMQEDARNTILVLRNYDGQDLAEFRHNLSQYGAVKVRSTEGESGGIDTLQIEVNAGNYEIVLKLLKRALIENARGFDASELRAAGGTPNEMNIRSVFSDIDLDANGMETEWQASMEDLLWFVTAHLANTGKGSFDGQEVNIIFNRDGILNESQTITDCKVSVGILSKETILSQHPWVTDVQEEIKRVDDEATKAAEQFGTGLFTDAAGAAGQADAAGGGVT